MKSDELNELKSEIKLLRKRMKTNVMRSDTERVEEDFYAIMDGYNRIRKHLNTSVPQYKNLSAEIEVVE